MDLSLDFPSQLWAPFALSRPPIRCSAGYLIYLQNTEATCFYYLKSGRVKSYIQSADGAERVLNIYPAGSLFGEASFFDKLPGSPPPWPSPPVSWSPSTGSWPPRRYPEIRSWPCP